LIISEVCRIVNMKKCALASRARHRDGDEGPMANKIHDIGIARQIGTYSDAVEVPANAHWLVTAGTPGLSAGGKVPSDFGAQAELAWSHIVIMLERAGMTVHDLVKVTQYLVRSSDIAAYAEVRARHLGSARPASLLLIVPGLVRPEFLLEIEACAAKA
jgi:2-iminobutanoate/2-iminopropanoate deaminase